MRSLDDLSKLWPGGKPAPGGDHPGSRAAATGRPAGCQRASQGPGAGDDAIQAWHPIERLRDPEGQTICFGSTACPTAETNPGGRRFAQMCEPAYSGTRKPTTLVICYPMSGNGCTSRIRQRQTTRRVPTAITPRGAAARHRPRIAVGPLPHHAAPLVQIVRPPFSSFTAWASCACRN
jgi:hypothetical protein